MLSAIAERLPRDAVVIEEAPSSKPELHRRIAARAPLGFVSPAMGGLGFAMPAAIGIKMARPERPVLAVIGDGSSLYAIQSLWTAAHYGVGAVFVILANGGYSVMDRLAELSPRQKEVMHLVAQGLSNKQIAVRLGISPRTVENYRAWVMERMGAANVAELQ